MPLTLTCVARSSVPHGLSRALLGGVALAHILGSFGCARPSSRPATKDAFGQQHATRLSHSFTETWRAAQMRNRQVGGPLATVQIGGSQGYGRPIRDSALAFLDFRGICTHRIGRADPREAYHRFFPESMGELFDSVRVPRSTDTGYCPHWWNAPQRHSTLVRAQESYFADVDRSLIGTVRAAMMDSLVAHLQRHPFDTVGVAQLARFAIDQGSPLRARAAADACAPTTTFCVRVQALLAYYEGAWHTADSLFTMANHQAPPSCSDSLVVLLVPRYLRDTGCASRTAKESILWWLADPLWGSPVNERRLKHERRLLEISFRRLVGRDEFFDFSAKQWDKALGVLVRYGWPSNFQPCGHCARADRTGYWWGATDDMTWRMGALNYSGDRYATIPPLSVLTEPARSTSSDWALPVYDAQRFRNPWPVEHLRLPYAFRTTERLQWARFYRATAQHAQLVVVAAASPYPHVETPAPPRDAQALIWMPDPSTRVVGTISLATVNTLAATIQMQLQDGVLSLEALPPRAQVWRARFGVPALTVPSSSVFLSDFLVTRPGVSAPLTPERGLVDLLLPSLTLDASQAAIGLYWELYGAPPTDSLTYSLRLRQRDGGTLGEALTRLATFGRLRRDDPQAITWTIPPEVGASSTVRRFTVDLSVAALPPGEYTLEIEAQGRDFLVRSASRELTKTRGP